MTSNAEIVAAIYAAFARQDIATLMELLDPQFEITQTDLLPWGGQYHGQQGALEFFGKLATYLDARPRPEEIIEAGDHIVAIGRVSGHVKANSQPFDVRLAHVWTLREGKALRFEAYIDTPGMLQALGQ